MVLEFSLKDLLLVVPAWTAAIVAVLGLNAWKRQLHGREGYDLARRLLRATYRYRDAIQQARTPFSFQSILAPVTAGASVDAREHAAALWQQRWDPIDSARRELLAELLEAEVLWGVEHRTQYQTLFDCESDLYAAVLEQLAAIGPEAEEDLTTPARSQSRRHRLYARADHTDDLSKALAAAVAPIEADLGPRLRRPRGTSRSLTRA
jgi:hypothetical protein